jgi:hypothetical protein
MKHKGSVWAVLALTVVLITGCARAAGPAKDPGGGLVPNSPFCQAITKFRLDTGKLDAGMAANPTAAAAAAAAGQTDLQGALAQLTGDPVFSGFKVADDVKAVANSFGAISAAVAKLRPGDVDGYANASNAANTKAVDQAASRLGGYVKQQCGLTDAGLPTTTTPPTAVTTATTAVVQGPVVGPSAGSTTSVP